MDKINSLLFFPKKTYFSKKKKGASKSRFLRNFCFIFFFSRKKSCAKKKSTQKFRKKRAPRDPDWDAVKSIFCIFFCYHKFFGNFLKKTVYCHLFEKNDKKKRKKPNGIFNNNVIHWSTIL